MLTSAVSSVISLLFYLLFRRFGKIMKRNYWLHHFSLSCCLSSRNNSVPTERIFMKFDIGALFEKNAEKVQVSLKSDKKNE
jgi:hypothetical protein